MIREKDVRQALDLFPGSFLIYGTLLGAVRDGGLIPWDTDVDLAYLSEDAPPKPSEVYREADIGDLALEHGVTAPNYGVMVGETKVGIQLLHEHDGFRYHTEMPGRLVRIPSELVEVLTTIVFLGREVLTPDRPERFLDWFYGDWRTPSKRHTRTATFQRRRREWLVE